MENLDTDCDVVQSDPACPIPRLVFDVLVISVNFVVSRGGKSGEFVMKVICQFLKCRAQKLSESLAHDAMAGDLALNATQKLIQVALKLGLEILGSGF